MKPFECQSAQQHTQRLLTPAYSTNKEVRASHADVIEVILFFLEKLLMNPDLFLFVLVIIFLMESWIQCLNTAIAYKLSFVITVSSQKAPFLQVFHFDLQKIKKFYSNLSSNLFQFFIIPYQISSIYISCRFFRPFDQIGWLLACYDTLHSDREGRILFLFYRILKTLPNSTSIYKK